MSLLQEAQVATAPNAEMTGDSQVNKAAATPEELVGLSASLDQLPPNSPPLFPLDKADKIYSGTAVRQPDQSPVPPTSEQERNQDNSVPWLPTVAALSFLEALATSTLVKNPRLRRNLQRLGLTGLILSLTTGCSEGGTPGTVAPTPAEGSTVTSPAEVSPTPVVTEGPVIPGQTLEMGGATLKLFIWNGQELASLVGAESQGWKIVAGSDGNVNCFIGQIEEGENLAVLGQGPAGYEWNSQAGVWLSGDRREGVVPDVILPGAWNAEQGQAGPTAWAESAFMVQVDGQYRIVVLYLPETARLLLENDGQGITILPDGRGMWTGDVVKRFNLDEGQSIVRDPETGTLTVLDSNGNPVRQMIVRWSEIQSPEQISQIGEWGAVTSPTEAPAATEPEEEILFTFTLEAGSNITAYEVSADGSLIFDDEGNPQVAGSLQVSIPGIEVLSESTDGYAKLKLPGGRIVWVKDADIAAYVPQVAEQPVPTAVPPVAPTPGGEQPPPAPVLPTPGGVEATPIPVEPAPVPPPPETQPGGAVMAPEEVPAHVDHGEGQFKKQAFDHNNWGVIPESAGREYVVQFRVLGASADGLRVDAGGVEKILPINGAPVYLTGHGYVGTINQLVQVPGIFLDGDAMVVYVKEFALRDTLTDAEIQASSITPIAIMMPGQ